MQNESNAFVYVGGKGVRENVKFGGGKCIAVKKEKKRNAKQKQNIISFQ